jgi:DNA-binding NtrC family response regulator
LVEPDARTVRALEAALQGVAATVSCADYRTARQRLSDTQPDLLVANLRLEAFNGLHLVYLARLVSPDTVCLVYQVHHDIGLARMVQAAGAFYERRECLPAAIAAYLEWDLPAQDRRDPANADRRGDFRGGRRVVDFRVVPGGLDL